MQPLVSILIPCYNGGPWVGRAIQSALDQTYTNIEIIAVDDGSQDDSLAIIRSFGDRIRHVTGPNRGGNAARNQALKQSRGEWLSFLDADDFLMATKIETQIAFLADRRNLDVVYGPSTWVGQDVNTQRTDPVHDDDLYANYFRWTLFSTNSLLLRRAVVEDVGGWNEKQEVCQEHELILRLILAGKEFALLPQSLVVNRAMASNSVSRRSPMKTLKQKMELSERCEDYLRERGEMNGVRRLALAQACFEAARTAYFWDRSYAQDMMKKARRGASLANLRGVNPSYRWAVQLVGFNMAECIAAFRRRLLPKSAAVSGI